MLFSSPKSLYSILLVFVLLACGEDPKPKAFITGVVRDGSELVSGATVMLLDESGEAINSTTTTVSGYFLFDEVNLGDYIIQVMATDFVDAEIRVSLTEKGVEGLDIDLSSTVADITGAIYDSRNLAPISNASVQLLADGTQVGVTTTDIYGEFSLLDVTEGSYSLLVTAVDYDDTTQLINLEGGLDQDIRLQLEFSLVPPENINADAESITVTLTWDVVESATSYNIYRKETTSTTFELVGNASTNTYKDLVESGTSYEYVITSVVGTTETEFSETIFVTTPSVTTAEAFETLAEFTGGEAYSSSSSSVLSTVIQDVILEHAVPSADLVFLIDKTGSMSDDISNVRTNLDAIINSLPASVRLGVAEYGDANVTPTDWFDFTPLSTDYTASRSFINAISPGGGGDIPESVYDGIVRTIESMNFLATKKMIIVIGDAPPLEGSRTTNSLTDVIDKANEAGVVTNIYPIIVSL